MSKPSSRLGRPGSAGSKSPSLKKELQGNRSCMLRIGERLMRAGSEGNLVQRPIPSQSQNLASSAGSGQRLYVQTRTPALEDKPTEHTGNNSSEDPGNFLSRVSSSSTSVESGAERLLQKKQHTNSSSLLCNPEMSSYGSAPRSPNTLPRSRDSQLDSLMMQQAEVERKKEVFLDHLRHKYPHHAAIIMGHQEQVRSLPSSETSLCAGVLVEQQDPVVSETMSDGEMLPPTAPFSRGCKARSSLPVGRSSGQTRERLFGVLYLQYGEETKQVRMPAEISSLDSLWALFITAFPHQLTMKMLQSPNMAIYIKDTNRNIYYDLEDVRNITPYSCLKVYHKDPAQVFTRHPRAASTDGRLSKEVLYSSHSPVHTQLSPGRTSLHGPQGSMSPPMAHSMPSSPSRIAYSTAGNATLPQKRSPNVGRSSAVSNSSSVILERRDVKPDDDIALRKNMAQMARGEGGAHYQDSYCSSLQDGGRGRLSYSSSQCSAPPSLNTDMVDAGILGIPGGLPQYRASVKPLMGYGESIEHPTHSLHRQKSRKYGDSQLPPLATKTPPPSPHRVSEVRMIEQGQVCPERMSPLRRSLRLDSNGATVEIINRSRGNGSTSSNSSVFIDSPVGQPERLFQGHVPGSPVQSDRMKAIEEQIASLAGLVHHALSMGPDVPGVKDTVSETSGHKIINNKPGASSEPQNASGLIDSFSPAPLALQAPSSDNRLQQSLVLAKRSVHELRLQLGQLRHLQLSNQESVNLMVRMAGQELAELMCNRLARSEEASYRRRAEMEEERIHYLATEEEILAQLRELENYVDGLQRSSTSSPGQPSVTLREVEEGAVSLRRVGEALANLKGEFPQLQIKMRSVLRLEVEAVRFLKEEPHKMDTMLRRVKALTEALSSLRRRVTESPPPPVRSAQVDSVNVLETDQRPQRTQSPKTSPRPQPRPSVTAPLSGSQAEVSAVGSASPTVACRTVHQPQHHHPSPPLTSTYGRDSPTVAKVRPRSREGSPALQRRGSPLQSAGGTATQESHTDQMIITHTETIEDSLHGETSSMNQSSTNEAKQSITTDSSQLPSANTNTDFNKVLQEAQASLMKSIPDLEVSDNREDCSDSASGRNTHLDQMLQASVEQQELLPDVHENKPSKQKDEVDTLLKLSDAAAKTSSHSQVEKLHRSGLDDETEQNLDKSSKSPPPPPPRRFHTVSSGLTTGKSGEVILTTRKEPDGAQDEGEKTTQERETPVVPQPKPPRQPPEVKPKPQMFVLSPPAGSNSNRDTIPSREEEEEDDDDDEEEEEDKKIMKELQVFQKYTVRDVGGRGVAALSASHLLSSEVTKGLSIKNKLPDGDERGKGEVRTSSSSSSQVANQKPSELAACSHHSAPQTRTTGDCSYELVTAGLADDVSPNEKKEAGESVVKPVPSSNCTTSQKMQVPPPAVSNKVQKNEEEPIATQMKGEKIEAHKEHDLTVCSPTTAENKKKFTTIVTLKKETDITSSDQTNGKVVKEVPADKKSNLTVIVTLQKENTSVERSIESSPELQLDKSQSSDQEGQTSVPIVRPSSLSLSPIHNLSSMQQNKETQEQVYNNRSLYSDDGCSLSPDTWDEGEPPPPPPPGGKNFRFSKARVKTQCSEGEQMNGDSSGEFTYLVHEDQGCEEKDKKPIIVILNEPMDIYSAYKRLSTIFESEEDLDGILSPESIVHEEQTNAEEEDCIKKLSFTELNTGLDLKEFCVNGQNYLHTQHERPSADNDSVSKDQNKVDSLGKTETKKKFKFKFPKNKLAAISQAIRTSTKPGKKPIEVVVYEEDEVAASDRKPVKETKKQMKEPKTSEINSTKHFNVSEGNGCDRDVKVSTPKLQKSNSRVEELCKSTLHSIDSLEESIKQLEISVDSITTCSPLPQSPAPAIDSAGRSQPQSKVKRDRERSPSKRPASQIPKGPNPPQSKRAKAQPPPHDTRKTYTKKQTSGSSSNSSAAQTHTKSRRLSSMNSPEKTRKDHQQDSQKKNSQPRVVIPR